MALFLKINKELKSEKKQIYFILSFCCVLFTCIIAQSNNQPCNFNKATIENGAELETECIQRMKKVQSLELWDGGGKPVSVDSLKKSLTNLINKMSIESVENKPYIKQFIPAVRKKITNLVNDRNKDWTKEYLAKIQIYNETRSTSQNFFDEISQLASSLENLLSQKKRLHSLTRIYLQNMAGIPTTYLIIGKSVWDPNSGIAPQVIFEKITHSASHYIASELSETLIFSNTTISNSKISSDVIKATKKVRVEEFETDPIYYTHGSRCYVIHKYRSYPMYSIPKSKDSDNSLDLETYQQNTQYWNIDASNISNYKNRSIFPDSLIKEANKQINDVKNENVVSIKQVQGFAITYKTSWNQINQKTGIIQVKINKLKKSIKEKINNLVKENEFQVNMTNPLKEFTNTDDVEKGDDLKESIINWLLKINNIFQNQKKDAEENINNWLKSRNMIVFTSKSEIMGFGEVPTEVASRLLSSAFESLEKRKRQLISYKLSTVKNGRLVSCEGENYYTQGLPIRYLIFPPILTYLGNPSGGSQYYNISLFLAWEVQYTEQKNKVSIEETSTKGQISTNIYYDQKQNLSWFFGNEECFSFQEAKQKLPKKFRLPLRNEMASLGIFVNMDDMAILRNQFNYLFQSGAELWTGEQSSVTDKIYTYIITSNEIFSHNASSCCYIVGVKVGK